MIPIAQPNTNTQEEQAILQVLRSGMLAQGEKVTELEQKFSKLIGTKYTIATSSGTSALHISLLAAGVKPGDEIITSPFSFISTANACLFVGAKPTFVDIQETDFNINPDLIKPAITKRTKAIIPVHLFGAPADMPTIARIAKKFKLKLIEDTCQAHDASIKGKKVGNWGLAGCFSLYATKNITSGEGGLITTNQKAFADKCKLLRSHGSKIRYQHHTLGFNFRTTDLQAAIAIEQLKKLSKFNQVRIKNALYLNQKITAPGIILPRITTEPRHVVHQYTIRITRQCPISRHQLVQALQNNHIGYGIFYPIPIHKQPLYRKLGYRIKLPIAEKLAKQVLSLPVHPLVTRKQLDLIARTVNQACQ
jgi:dTDP-4-amino-4,6-dideoxygalactose transaminase